MRPSFHFLLKVVLAPVFPAAMAGDLTTWPSQYMIRPWESARLTDADVVGPDGIVYPDFTGTGVTGGVPDINAPEVRSTYTIFNVRTGGAKGDGVALDDAAVAAASSEALAHAAGGGKAILYFPAGTYLLSAPIDLGKSNVVVDGDGPDATLIKLTAGTAKTGVLFSFKQARDYPPNMHLAATAPRGAKTVTFEKDPALAYKTGDWVRLLPTLSGSGTTMSDRFSNPDNHVIYNDAVSHTGRAFYAKVISLDSASKTAAFDRTLTHDYYLDEAPQFRKHLFVEHCGLQDLSIETLNASVSNDPVRFENAAESWIKNITISKARNWPLWLQSVTRFEVRDSRFLGTWAEINNGSNAYFGWIDATDSLMDNVHASDLRHMAIFQFANRCVIRASTFTGRTITSPQLHGRFPHENLIEGCTFDFTGTDGKSSRGISAYASDGAASLRHGVEGPRNVFYNNQVNKGAGYVSLGGMKENLIFVYNRVLKTDDNESYPAIVARDRSFDVIIRGNIFQAMTHVPFILFEDPTCTGWQVTDNKIYGSNGYLYEGDSAPALAHNNRFYDASTTPDAATTPEVSSIYAWQKTYANTPRLVLVIDRRTVTDTGGVTGGIVTRVKTSTTAPLTVNLSADSPGLSVPPTVTIPAGQTSAKFKITGADVTDGEKTVTLTAADPAGALMDDTEKVFVLDQADPQPNFGEGKWPVPAAGLPAGWRAASFGYNTAPSSQSFTDDTNTWAISGGGIRTETYHNSLVRSGRRFVYQTVDGNNELRARLTAASGTSQVGLMVADDEATFTEFVWVEPSGLVLSSANGLSGTHGTPVIQAQIALVGTAFTHQFKVSNNANAFALTKGALPPGIALNPANGIVSGTPTTAGTYSFAITATKTDSPTAIVPFSITVNTTAQPLPVWLRIKRSGFVFDVFRSAAASPSEADWTRLASIDMYRDTLDTSSPDYKSPAVLDKRMHYGMFINSGSQAGAATASFTGTKNTGDVIFPAAGTR